MLMLPFVQFKHVYERTTYGKSKVPDISWYYTYYIGKKGVPILSSIVPIKIISRSVCGNSARCDRPYHPLCLDTRKPPALAIDQCMKNNNMKKISIINYIVKSS